MHYVNLSAGEDARYTLSQLMMCVHGFNAPRASNDRIAVGFPAMQEAIIDERGKVLQMPQAGPVLRLFGTTEQLQSFLSSVGPARLVKGGAVVKSAMQVVPERAHAVRFVRDRMLSRHQPNSAYARRQKARAEAQGREYHRPKRIKPEVFSFESRSASTGHTFHLDVRKEMADGEAILANVTAYGLCGEGTAVPMF